MRFYKLNGVWRSWDYLHNELGYAEHTTRPTVFKSCADATWGEDAGNGYYDGDVSDMINGTFWTDADPTGWFDLDSLVWNSETYPADAAPSLLVKDGVASDALVITCDDGNYYLIRAIIDTTAWIPESEVEALGWRSPSFVVVDSTTGKVVSGCNQELTTYELPSVVLNSEDGYETYELPSVSLQTPNVVIGVPISWPVQTFWFTDEGRAETSDKTFTVVGNPLFDEDGSVARNELYDSAVPLSFMQHDGNMFEADSDSDIIRYLPVTDRLVLSIPGDSTTRDKSAWSVQCAKLFVLSYANTQLPDVQIELPINEVGTYGTVITLPTIDGEYESGGKTWKPSAWDIGAFGSSYTLNADTVAHLLFEEVQQYQEITLYMASGNKTTQNLITSSFTGDVNSAAVTQLFYDAECTDPFVYDYSNEYEVGRYIDGVWTPRVNRVSDMPSSTTPSLSSATRGFILYDTGGVWIFTNFSGTWLYNGNPITVRIYPKEQQHYAAYFNFNHAYTNNNFTTSTKTVYFSPTGGPSARFFGHYIADNGTLVDVLDSGGSSVKKVGDGLGASSVSGNSYLQLWQPSSTSRNARAMTFTLPHPTFIGWLHADHTDQQVSSGTVKKLLDDDGNEIAYNANLKYIAVCIFAVSNSGGAEALFDGQYCIGSDDTYPGALCFKQVYGSITANRIWITTETVDNYIWAYFTSSGSAIGTNTPQTNGEVYPLYDENGAPILYDATKQYETLEVQYVASGKYLMRGEVKYSSYEGGAGVQLQCIALYTDAIGAKRIKVWIKPL